MGAVIQGDVWDFYLGKGEPKAALPVGTVLTIPAAGSESSTGSVITNDDGQLKRAVNSELIYPQFSILDPELAFTLPRFQTACGASDIMAHLMERYFTTVGHVEFTDRLLEATMKTIALMAPRVLENPRDYDAWSEFMWAGTIAHNNLLNTGRIGDWASHDIEHEISGICDVAHGAGGNTAAGGFLSFHGLGTRLSELKVGTDRLDEMASKCTDGNKHTVGNFVKLDTAGVRRAPFSVVSNRAWIPR